MKKTQKKENITLRQFLKTHNISIEKCSKDTKITTPTLYGVWNGDKKPSRKNEEILKKYTKGLVSW